MKAKQFSISLICFVALLLFVKPASTQELKKMTFQAGEVTLIAGLGALITCGDSGLIVEMVPPKGQRIKEYKNVDIANKDKIIMCNGKKVKTIVDLNTVLEDVKIGDEVSLGIKRGKEMMIVSFLKADPKDSGNMMMMTTTTDDNGTHNETTLMHDGIKMTGIVMLDAGLILKDKDGKSTIFDVLPKFSENIKGQAPQEGDIIVSINGEKDLSSEEISKKYDAIKIGELVSMIISRESKEHTIEFNKIAPSNDGNVIIRK